MPAISSATIRVGTRRSALARRQTGIVVDALSQSRPDLEFRLVEITSAGDRDRRTSIERLGVGVFVKALEDALEDGRVDVVVHSLKDMPSTVPEGYEIAAVTAREDPRDALVNRWGSPFAELPAGARIGTGSPRRTAQALSVRPDLEVRPMRGNVPTRLAKALAGEGGEYDGAILAAAGMARLGRLGEASDLLEPSVFVPAAGQGSLAVEIRANERDLRAIASAVNDADAAAASEAERAFMREIEAGCSVPVGAYARIERGSLVISGFVSDPGGARAVRRTIAGDAGEPVALGRALAAEMAAEGAIEILAEIKRG